MKTTSRRKMLISSVAMLLVAMIALGTATFAWFTTNTTATASGINVKTVAASDLQIAKYDKIYGSEVKYGVSGQVLYPASSANGTDWFTTTAADQTSYLKDTDASITDVSNNYIGNGATETTNRYYFKDKLYIMNAGKTTIENITISASFSWDSNNYLRVAVVKSGGTFSSNVYSDNTDSYDAYVNTSGSVQGITPVGTNLTSISVGSLASEAVAEYDIYVWYEGQDSDCKSTNAGKELKDINFTVTGTPVN